jgi:hypothetical protein
MWHGASIGATRIHQSKLFVEYSRMLQHLENAPRPRGELSLETATMVTACICHGTLPNLCIESTTNGYTKLENRKNQVNSHVYTTSALDAQLPLVSSAAGDGISRDHVMVRKLYMSFCQKLVTFV